MAYISLLSLAVDMAPGNDVHEEPSKCSVYSLYRPSETR